MQAQSQTTTLFIALHDSAKGRYDIISANGVTPEEERAFGAFLLKENKEDLKHFWTRIAQYKTVRLATAAPIVVRFFVNVRIAWSLATKSVSESAAKSISTGFGYPIQECSFVEEPVSTPIALMALGDIFEDFLKPRQAKRQRTEDETPAAAASSLPPKK